MVHEVVLFILDASMARAPFAGACTGKNRLSYAQEAIEEIIFHYLTSSKSNTYEIGVLSYHSSTTSNEATESVVDPAMEMETDTYHVSPGRDDNSVVRLTHPTVLLLQSLHNLFGGNSLDSSLSIGVDKSLESYVEIKGSYIEGIFLAAEIFKQKAANVTNKRTKIRFKIVMLTDATEKLVFDVEKLDEALNVLRSMECSLTTIGFDFLHCNVHEFSSLSMEAEDMKEDMVDISSDIATQYPIQYENESFIISLTRALTGAVFPVKSRWMLQKSIKRMLAIDGHHHPSSKKGIELVLAPNLSISTRMSLLSSRSTLPSLKREAILLDPDTGEERIDQFGFITGRIQSTTIYWDIDNTLCEVPDTKRISVVQFGSKDRFPVGVFDLHGLQIRSQSAITILGYVPSHTVSPGLLLGPTRIIFGGDKRSCVVISALARALQSLDLYALCTFVPKADSDPQMGVIMPHLESRDAIPNRLLFLRCPFSDDIQNIQSIASKYPLECLEPLSRDEETTCENLIESLMLPEMDSMGFDSQYPINPTRRLFQHFARDKATHMNHSTECSHHTYTSSTFVRDKTYHDSKAIHERDENVVNDDLNNEKRETSVNAEDVITEDQEEDVGHAVHEKDHEENLLSTPDLLLDKARFSLEQFRLLFPLRKIPKKQRTYWSDCY